MHLLNVGLHATHALNLWHVCKAEDHLEDQVSLLSGSQGSNSGCQD